MPVIAIIWSGFNVELVLNYFTRGEFLEMWEASLRSHQGLVFLLTTFFTSILWALFAVFVAFVRTCQLVSPFLRILLSTVANSENPARAAAGFICAFVTFGYGVAWLVQFLT